MNLQQCKSASAVLARHVSMLQTSIALIQELWLNKGKLRDCEQCFSVIGEDVRACIYIKDLRADLWAWHCGRDLAAIRVQYKKREGQGCEMIVALAYFPYNVDAPPAQGVRDIIRDFKSVSWTSSHVCQTTHKVMLLYIYEYHTKALPYVLFAIHLERSWTLPKPEKEDLVIGCDASSHHTVWGSTVCNFKGRIFLNSLAPQI